MSDQEFIDKVAIEVMRIFMQASIEHKVETKPSDICKAAFDMANGMLSIRKKESNDA